MRFVLPLVTLLLMPAVAHADESAPSSTAVETAPADPETLRQQRLDSLLGKLHSPSPHMDAARIEQEILEIWGRNSSPTAEVLLRQSSVAITAGDLGPAEQMLSQLVESYPNFAEAWSRRASLYYVMRRYDAGLIDIEKSLSLEPRNFSALLGKGLLLNAQGKSDDAIAALKEALAIDPHMQSVRDEIKVIENSTPHV